MEQQKSKNSLRICKNCDKSRLVYKNNLCFICDAIQNQKKQEEDEETCLDIDSDKIIKIKVKGGGSNGKNNC